MTFVVKGTWDLTSDFNQPRPLWKPEAERDRIHGGWDIATVLKEPIYAPENGDLIFHKIWRSDRSQRSDRLWPDNMWYAFSNYYQDVYGCCLVLHGRRWTHLMAHIEEDDFYRMLFTMGVDYQVFRDGSSYRDWVRGVLNLGSPRKVREGDVIGFVGDAGSSAGAHIHYELHRERDWKQHDPITLWRDELAIANRRRNL